MLSPELLKKKSDAMSVTNLYKKRELKVKMYFTKKEMQLLHDIRSGLKVMDIESFKLFYNIGLTTNHNDKMAGMISLSTSPLVNDLCIQRSENPESICHYCYSNTINKRFQGLSRKNIFNTCILTSRIFEKWELPFINAFVFRLEAFGDLNNDIQVVNYFNICRKNPHCNFALWTKNPQFIKKAMQRFGIEKPANITIIYSNPILNGSDAIYYGIKKMYSFVDKMFTVYDKKYIKKNNIVINCGAAQCLNCLLCYLKNDVVFIREQKK